MAEPTPQHAAPSGGEESLLYTEAAWSLTEAFEQVFFSQIDLDRQPVSSASENSLSALTQFIAGELDTEQALRLWLGNFRGRIEELGYQAWRQHASRLISRTLGEIDRLLAEQLNEILHAPRFQALEAAWRGLEMLTNTVQTEGARQVQIRCLSVTWRELQRDFERASDFDNSHLFRKIYEDEFGTPGGTPYSVLIGDYEIHPRPTPEHPYDDIAVLGHLAGVAAAAFCPFVCAASPAMFGVNHFTELQSTKDLARGFQLAEFVKWRSLRKVEDARFVGLAVPRILMRPPYTIEETQGFCFEEDVSAPHLGRHLWGNAAFAWGCVLIRTFARSGWLADIRGTERNRDGGGLVSNLPAVTFATDRPGIAVKCSTDLIVTDQQEAILSKLGFLPLSHCHDTEYAAFYSSQSIQEAARYDNPAATANAHISTMLQYMLCVSRFAHYLKVIARDIVGSAAEAEDMQNLLDRWVKSYVTPDESARPEVKAKRPLRQAEVTVQRDPGRPGTYQCTFSLLPHYQLDDLSAAIRLQTVTRLSRND
jgi:type VI secretion system ImpC/EvpB family protein